MLTLYLFFSLKQGVSVTQIKYKYTYEISYLFIEINEFSVGKFETLDNF